MCKRLLMVLCLIAGLVPPAVADQASSSPYTELRAGRVAELDARLNGLQTAFERDERAGDDALQAAFGAFDNLPRNAQETEENLAQWIARYPRSYAARLARGIYRFQRGLDARGEKSAKETPPESFEMMRDWFEKAREDFHASLDLAAKPVVTRTFLIAAAMRSGSKQEIDEHYRSAIAYAPRSMALRTTFMQSLEPRWGGSEQEMMRYAALTRTELTDTRNADRIEAMVPGDRGLRLMEAQDYAPAHAALSRAIDLADVPIYRCVRAFVADKLQKQADMLADMQAALAGRPYAGYCGDLAAAFVGQNHNLPGAFEIVDGFLLRDPDHAGLLAQRGWLLKERGDMASAYKDFVRAADLGNAWAQTMAGKYLFNGWGGVVADREKGLALLRRAADQGEPSARLSVVQALQAMRRSDEAASEQARFAKAAGTPVARTWFESLSELLTPSSTAALLGVLLAALLGLRLWRSRR